MAFKPVNQNQNQSQGQKQEPDFEIRCGKIRGSVWSKEVQGDNGKYTQYSVQVEKSYKDGKDWKKTTSFFPDELPLLQIVAAECHKHISITSCKAK